MRLFHDSNDAEYRSFDGGAIAGENIVIRLKCDITDAKAYLRLWWHDEEIMLEMKREGDMFSREMTLPDEIGVMWYFFVVDTPEERTYYGNAHDCLDGVGEEYAHEPPGYQITVYSRDYKTPEWMRDSVIYQIMPDRFFASKPLEQRPMPYMGWLHEDWNEPVALSKGEANDFFGGDLNGIAQKLDYLADMGIRAIYLNPIFRARSNHKYDTGDYMQIDPSFGTESDFKNLCALARKKGIRVMLDGVFSHTGSVSRYFNIDGSYDDAGAYQSRESRYFGWYRFKNWPDDYDCWWGFKTLPNVNECDSGFEDFIINGSDSVMAHWLNLGASGWRLDVADELPMNFIRQARKRIKQLDGENAILGEVWEDASNKVAYSETRAYCLGDTLDSVMNYPLRDMLIGFMLSDVDSTRFVRRYAHMKNAYPAPFFYSLMNLLGSHDKPRIIDVMSGAMDAEPPREERRFRKLDKERYDTGRRRFAAAWAFICALPGMPCLYYADEVGQTGMADPFNRQTYPWGREDERLKEEIKRAIKKRNALSVLRRGLVRLYAPSPDVIACVRFIKNKTDALGCKADDDVIVCALNRRNEDIEIKIEPDDVLLDGVKFLTRAESVTFYEGGTYG